MSKMNLSNLRYRGYVSVVCNDSTCGKTLISPANRFKRDRADQILCPSCYKVAKAYALPAESRECPMCRIDYSSTNPRRIYCEPACRTKAQTLRKEAKKIHNGKKRKKAVDEIYDFLNG